jgi:hypothetical protein
MNCEDAPRLVGLPDDDPRAREMRAHIRACAACRALVDHQNNVRATMALKRYEQPPPGFSERCAADIRRALEQQAAAPATAWWREYMGAAFQPLRLAAAAVLLAGLGFYFWRPAPERAGPLPASWSQIRLDATAPAAPLGLAADNTPLLMAASNSGALHMNYGPGAAVPVKFEY